MIIGSLHQTINNGEIRISSKIEWSVPHTTFPEHLWYQFPKVYGDQDEYNSDAFLASLTVIAMFYKEDIHVCGKVSSNLLYNLREYQERLHFWNPADFSIIKITTDSVIPSSVNVDDEKGVMCSYSGGVDSTYTLWTHLPQNEINKDFQVTHSMYIEGIDLQEGADTSAAKNKTFSKFMSSIDIKFIPVSTNIRHFHVFQIGSIQVPTKLYYTWSSMVIGTSLLFDSVIKRFYFSLDNTHEWPIQCTIGNYVANLLSTNNVDVLTDGGSVSKIEKIKVISKWEDTYDKLTICHESPKGLQNCGECEKCSMLSTALEMENVLGKYSTFPDTVDRKIVRKGVYIKEHYYYLQAWISFAETKRRKDIAFDYTYILYKSRLLHHVKIGQKVMCNFSMFISPVHNMYRLSYILKQYSPKYARFITFVKS